FFFSSRRRHTRWPRDWSSDVCSSDLHWTELTRNAGLPRGLLGNIGLAVSPAKPSRVWALIEADSGGVYRSDDGGTTWAWINHDHKLRVRAWYYMKLTADPKDPDGVYATNV